MGAVPMCNGLLFCLVFFAVAMVPATAVNLPDPPPPAPMSVLIQNRLPGQLNVHCYTRNSDLSLHPMAPNADYKFLFKLNFWGTTSFHCRFNYVATPMWQAFNVWNGPGIWATTYWPCSQCIWMVNLDGFSRAQAGKPLVIIHPWRQDVPSEKFLTAELSSLDQDDSSPPTSP